MTISLYIRQLCLCLCFTERIVFVDVSLPVVVFLPFCLSVCMSTSRPLNYSSVADSISNPQCLSFSRSCRKTPFIWTFCNYDGKRQIRRERNRPWIQNC